MLPLDDFGATGHRSTRVIFGAAALGAMSQERADTTLALVRDRGVNHIDTAASYGDSELRLAPFLADHRADVFLATKTGERSGGGARAELERSLTRLGVDRVDLIQLHNLVEPDQWETAFAPDGAVAALRRARDEGLVAHVGVTGHGLRIAGMHLRSLDRADLDSVLFPLNHDLMTRHPGYADDVRRLLAVCAERDVAVQTIKAVARRRWADPSTPHRSWYEPLDDPGAIARAVRWVLSEPRCFLNTSSDARLLPAVLDAAEGDLTRPSHAEMEADHDTFAVASIFDGAELERI